MLHHIITKPSHDRDGALSRRRSPHYVAFATAMPAAAGLPKTIAPMAR